MRIAASSDSGSLIDFRIFSKACHVSKFIKPGILYCFCIIVFVSGFCIVSFVGTDSVTIFGETGNDFGETGNDFGETGNDSVSSIITCSGNDSLLILVTISLPVSVTIFNGDNHNS
jgi:hypothetical protein